MGAERSPETTRRRLLQLSAVTATTGLAGCMGGSDEQPQPGVTIIESPTATGTSPSSTRSPTGNPDNEDATTTDRPASETPTEADTESPPTESDDTDTEEHDRDPTDTETETETETESETTHQLRIIAAEGADAFEYSFTIDGDAEMVTHGEYNAVPKDETADGRGEEIVDNGDGTVTINGVVADGGGDTFRFTGEIASSSINGPAEVYVDGELVEETGLSPNIDSCVTIDEPGEYVLTDDLSGSSDVCIDIRASDVTLDGDDHTIVGSNNQGTGIAVSGSDVTIRNVTVRDFDVGMALDGTRVEQCVVTGNSTGVQFLSPGSRGRIVDSEVSDNVEDGIVVEAAEGTRINIQDNQVVGNGRYGVRLAAADVDVFENAIEDNAEWGVWADDCEVFFDSNEIWTNGGGIHLVGRAIIDNEVVGGNLGPGMVVAGETEIWASTIRENDGDGVRVVANGAGGSATLGSCFITDNDESGIVAKVDLSVQESAIEANGSYGVQYTGDGVGEARFNYWGASDGPSSPDDPDAPFKDPERNEYADGSGDAVSEGETPGVASIRFAPWSTTRP